MNVSVVTDKFMNREKRKQGVFYELRAVNIVQYFGVYKTIERHLEIREAGLPN